MNNFKSNIINQFQISEIEADQIIYLLQIIFSDLSKVAIILIPFLYTGYLIEYFSILGLTLVLKSQAGSFHFKNYWSCLIFTSLYFISILLLMKLNINKNILIGLGSLAVIIIAILSPMLSEQKKKIKRLNIKALKIRALAISLLYVSFFIIKNNPFTHSAIWVVIIQSSLLLIQKGVSHVTKR
ncbi:MAG: accessory gene regulator B family protein [Clostridiales bacterium]|nr:accessory gene regulator B family protein [Clostridiales bacterium]